MGESASDAKHEASETAKTGAIPVSEKGTISEEGREKSCTGRMKRSGTLAQAENSGEKTKKKASEQVQEAARQMKEKGEITWKKLDDLKAAGSEKGETIKKGTRYHAR